MAEVFSQALSSSWDVQLKDIESSGQAAETSRLCFSLSVSGGLQGEAAIRISSADALLVAQRSLKEPAEPSQELTSERKEALEELLRQVISVAATTLKGHFGDVKLELGAKELPTDGVTAVVLLAAEGSSAPAFELRLGKELTDSLDSAAAKRIGQHQEANPADNPRDGEGGMDRLVGVDLSLSLRFGQCSLTLREILDLSSGSIIELDQKVDEPAELLLGHKVIARGEVVVIDGNYGIRVTEASRPA